MHPKAGILALHGARPMIYIGTWGETLEYNYRIQRPVYSRDQSLNKQLQRSVSLLDGTTVWAMLIGAPAISYRNITWEDIPDELMDDLPMDLIEIFVSTF